MNENLSKNLSENNVPKNVQWLFERCLICNFTSLERISNIIKNKKKAYVGFDITKPSLQLGNMVSLNLAEMLTSKGVETYVVLGGATTLVGDPSGKKEEREISKEQEIMDGLNKVKSFLSKHYPSLKVLNNKDWWQKINTIEFLRMSKSIGINYLLDRQLIKDRLNTNGISFTEFSYTIIQGLDFSYLSKNKDVMMQVGGSDQWGNFLSGYSLITKECDEVACFSTPLLVDSNGEKFGKTAGNALFIDKRMTSSYEMYQAIMNFPDNYLKILFRMLTSTPIKNIGSIIEKHNEKPFLRHGQEELAKIIISKTRSIEEYKYAKKISGLLFKKDFVSLTKADIDFISSSNLFYEVKKNNQSITSILKHSGLTTSISEGRRLISSGGIKINNESCKEDQDLNNFNEIKKCFFLTKGKRNVIVIKLVD